MKRKRAVYLALAMVGCTVLTAAAQNQSDQYIFPDPARKFIVAAAKGSGDKSISGRELPSSDPLARLITEDLAQPFNWQMIRMSQCARNFAGDTAGPNLLLVSGNEGGFPRTGIRLTSGNGREVNYPALQYVDLVLDSSRVARGDLSIYSHELGHVMMGLILGGKIETLEVETSPKQHVSMGVTDYLTAFYEGWGIHFQRLALDGTEKYRQAADKRLAPERAAGLAWHSGLDEYLRINLVRDNGYIYQKLVQTGPDTRNLTLEQRILLEHTSPAFDHTRLKNAQQMLSSEGVAATLFYQAAIHPGIGSHYMPAAFYEPFLAKPLPPETDPAGVFSPEENFLLKNFWIWKKMSGMAFTGSPLITWVSAWCSEFPDDRREMLGLFVRITRGITIDRELAELTARLNYFGQVGDYARFSGLRDSVTESERRHIDRCLADPELLHANVGPELWIKSDRQKIRRALWMPQNQTWLAVNLNTAGEAEMEAFLEPARAEEFISKRTELGYFISFDQLVQLGFPELRR